MARADLCRAYAARVAAAITIATLGLACADDDECDLEARSRELGGPGLIDCGVATGDPGVVDRCALTAYENEQTFRAVYETDEGMLEALVRVAGGDYLLVRETSEGLERVDCGGARVVTRSGRSFVECTEPGDPRMLCH